MKLWAPLRLLVTAWALVWAGFITFTISSLVILAGLLGASQESLQKLARLWAGLILKVAFCSVEVRGLENLSAGESYVFVSNHTSALDIPALQIVLPANFRWIAKKELFDIPIFGKAMMHAGYVPIDRSDGRKAVRSLNTAAKRIAEGASVVIFPEGTRSDGEDLLPFKSGGLALAIKSGKPVVPLAIKGASRALPPGSFRLNPGRVQIFMGTPMPMEGVDMSSRDDLALAVRGEVQKLLAGDSSKRD